ncbi:hypothetical protein CCACVL1_17208, partial [Corchorus capsularis]
MARERAEGYICTKLFNGKHILINGEGCDLETKGKYFDPDDPRLEYYFNRQ